MKTLKFKCVGEDGRLFPQAEAVPVGMSRDGEVQTYEVRDIPDDVEANRVRRLADTTVWWNRKTYVAAFAELGEGRILSEIMA